MRLEGSRGRRQGSCMLGKRFRIYPGGQELANYRPQINSDLLPVSIVLSEHGQAHSFTYGLSTSLSDFTLRWQS